MKMITVYFEGQAIYLVDEIAQKIGIKEGYEITDEKELENTLNINMTYMSDRLDLLKVNPEMN